MSDPLVVLVTGASQGIGAATARAFPAAGHKVVLAARNKDKLEAVAASAAPSTPVASDVTDPTSVAALFARIGAVHGRLDVVFNNAGANVPPRDVGDISWEDWRKVVSINLDGAFLIATGAFRLMRAQVPQGGRIINNGSISAHVPRYSSAPYTASKHAITGLTKTIALDGRPYGIACGQIDIGNGASEMTARMSRGVPQADGSWRPSRAWTSLRRRGRRADGTAASTNVQFQTIMATKMPFVGRG